MRAELRKKSQKITFPPTRDTRVQPPMAQPAEHPAIGPAARRHRALRSSHCSREGGELQGSAGRGVCGFMGGQRKVWGASYLPQIPTDAMEQCP